MTRAALLFSIISLVVPSWARAEAPTVVSFQEAIAAEANEPNENDGDDVDGEHVDSPEEILDDGRPDVGSTWSTVAVLSLAIPAGCCGVACCMGCGGAMGQSQAQQVSEPGGPSFDHLPAVYAGACATCAAGPAVVGPFASALGLAALLQAPVDWVAGIAGLAVTAAIISAGLILGFVPLALSFGLASIVTAPDYLMSAGFGLAATTGGLTVAMSSMTAPAVGAITYWALADSPEELAALAGGLGEVPASAQEDQLESGEREFGLADQVSARVKQQVY